MRATEMIVAERDVLGRGGEAEESREWIKRTFEISIKRDFDAHGTRPEGKFTECCAGVRSERYERGSFRSGTKSLAGRWGGGAGARGGGGGHGARVV